MMTTPNHDHPADPDALYGVIRLVRPLFKTLYNAVEANLAGTGVTIPMRGLMECLTGVGPCTVPQLARMLMLKRQVVQRMVNELIGAGFGEAVANEAHARSSLIRLTDAGHNAFAALRAVEEARTVPVAAALSAADVEACRRVMAAMIAAYTPSRSNDGASHDDR
jgi:DNA-binding MarR family transcriptional regulator